MPKTVIIIDDDPDDLDIMKQTIAGVDSSLLCISFIYPEEALRMLLSKELVVLPDFIFIDINMPVLSGDKCLKVLRSRTEFNDIKITLYSTSMPSPVAEALKSEGANYVFEKPVRLKAYSEIIAGILSA
jgi:CheY-like chemotaxis protein